MSATRLASCRQSERDLLRVQRLRLCLDGRPSAVVVERRGRREVRLAAGEGDVCGLCGFRGCRQLAQLAGDRFDTRGLVPLLVRATRRRIWDPTRRQPPWARNGVAGRTGGQRGDTFLREQGRGVGAELLDGVR